MNFTQKNRNTGVTKKNPNSQVLLFNLNLNLFESNFLHREPLISEQTGSDDIRTGGMPDVHTAAGKWPGSIAVRRLRCFKQQEEFFFSQRGCGQQVHYGQ